MKNNRRDFLKMIGFGGAGLMISAGCMNNDRPSRRQNFNMHGYAAPPLETVRVGISGIGARGLGTVHRLARIEGVEIKALNDILPEKVEQGIAALNGTPHNPDGYSGREDSWKEMCERDDIDLFVIVTPWHLHAQQAVCAMEHEKHVYMELPAATTIEECWQLVETSERTHRHCFQLSGDCHGGIAAVLLNMIRQGFFGELIHGEGSYIHDRVSSYNSRWARDEFDWFGFRPWRLEENIGRHGNLYPQHGLGPVAQMMDLNYGDQMDYLVSMSSNDFTLGVKMKELAADDKFWEPYIGQDFRGNINTTVIRTKKGRTIMLQHDVSSPRPDVRFDLISGTRGVFRARPSRIATSHDGWIEEEEFNSLVQTYTPKLNKRFSELVDDIGGLSGPGYSRTGARDWRLIDCLRNGLPLENDVYDAVLWSAVTPLSEESVANRSKSIEVPDFTTGAWETNKRGMDINLENGGGTTKLINLS